MELRKLTEKEVEITLELEEEYDQALERSLISGEEEYREQELAEIADIRKRLYDYGDQWAWCTVKVSAKWNGFEGVNYLGCCSYKDENEFKAERGYYQQMIEEAISDLNNEIAETYNAIKTLEC